MRGSVLCMIMIFITAGVLLTPAAVSASTVTWDFSMERSDADFSEPVSGKQRFTGIEGFQMTGFLDYPQIPYRVVTLLIPQGEKVSSIELADVESIDFEKPVLLANYNGELLEDGTKLGLTADKEDIITSDSVFPKWQIRHLGTNNYREYRIASIAIYPIHYSIDTGELEMITRAKLIVETAPRDSKGSDAKRIRHIKGFRKESRKIVESMVENKDLSSSYLFQDIRVDDTKRAFLPSYMPSTEGSEVKYIIITNEEMKATFQEFADRKTREGIPAVVKTVQWIENNYRNGVDKAESVRNFIQEAYAKWGSEWVLLAGDTDVIPDRVAYVNFYYGEYIPTDMYYSCLDGTWNADGDSLWGEAPAVTAGDDADLYSEVYVGRMPVSTVEEAELLINKTIDYETPADTTSKEEFLMLGEVIFPSDYSPGDDIILDGAELLDGIYQSWLQGHPEITTDRLYENYPAYPGSVELTKANALSYLNAGTNHVVDAGHGYKYNMSVGDASILNYDANNLTNGDALFSMYLMNCTNAAFDTDCLAEYFLLNDTGGAYAVTGSSRSAFPSTSRLYMDEYYRLLFDENITELGKLYTLSREPFTSSALSESSHRWTHFICNLLGDPEAVMYNGAVKNFTVTIPPSLAMGENDVTVTVQSDGVPFDSARVCLYKENDDYIYGNTDLSGEITFDNFLCREEGEVYVAVTGLNHSIYLDTIQVLQENDSYLRVSDKNCSDSSGGNGDGLIDSGEALNLSIEIENTGSTDAEKLYAILSSSDTGVTVTDSTAIYPDITAGGEEFGNDPFSFSVSPGYEDEEVIEFQIAIHDSSGSVWSENFAFEVHAPRIELYVNSKSDELPYGDGDGTVETGENFLLKIGVKNFGTGSAVGLEGVISSLDPDLTVIDGVSTYNDISPLEIGYGSGFVVSEDSLNRNNYFSLTFTDNCGRVFTEQLELREPQAPENVNLDASLGADQIVLFWHHASSGDTLNDFLVYRSLSSGGPFNKVSKDLLFHTTYHDYGLLSSTHYYYLIAAVDSCGNIGPYCNEVSITTSPAQQTGWPNRMQKETSSSPKIGDIDGDRDNELVIGSDYIYAWHEDGIEIRDGDNKPLTWG
ncbi:MAG TPA: C25 family cysteine peptidase, partial [Candidatus Krumholzibacteriaceae bacterium]|nr:C25 family cysteine peptidase [Candidatus Krumholzibacteriaceae bacterium]